MFLRNIGPYKRQRNIQEDGILHSHRRQYLKFNIELTDCGLYRRCNVSPVKYELGFYIPEHGILHSHRRANLKFNTEVTGCAL
jgi:hypothetical protein